MALGGGVGRFARGKPEATDGAAVAVGASMTDQGSNLASNTAGNDDPIDNSNWISFGGFESGGGATDDFDVSGVGVGLGTDFNDFGLTEADGTPMETEYTLDEYEAPPKQDGSSAAAKTAPPPGINLFRAKAPPTAQQDNTSRAGPFSASRNVPELEGNENKGVPSRVLPGGSSNPSQTMTREGSYEATPMSGKSADSESTGRQGSLPSNRGFSFLRTKSSSPANLLDAARNGGDTGGSSFPPSTVPNATNWTSTFDPNQGYFTANDSTRVIPAAPSAGKRSRVSPVTPAESVANITQMTESSWYSQSTKDGRTGDPGRHGSNQSSFPSTPGDSLTSRIPMVTPGADSTYTAGSSADAAALPANTSPQSVQKSASAGFPNPEQETRATGFPNPEQQTRASISPCPPVTPTQDSIQDASNPTESREDNCNQDDMQGLNFEDLHAKFLMDIRDLKDQQDDNWSCLVYMQGLFATAYGKSLQDQANLVDLLSGVEEIKETAEALTLKLEAF